MPYAAALISGSTERTHESAAPEGDATREPIDAEALALLNTIKHHLKQSDNNSHQAGLVGWLQQTFGANVLQDDSEDSEERLLAAVVRYVRQERYRRERSLAFRKKRMEALLKLRQDVLMRKQIAKNKNRQDAARKRVRDNNGKFQGGLLYRKPKILFLVEKVNRKACTPANPHQTLSPLQASHPA